MNVFVFSGNLGGDAEMRVTKTGTELCQFSVAVKAGYGQNESTTWVRCTLFGKRAQSLAPYLLKGQQVVVSGEAKLHEYTNKAGENKSSLEVNVNDVTLVGGKPAQADQRSDPAQHASGNRAPQNPTYAPAGGDFDQDIPFAQFDRGQFA